MNIMDSYNQERRWYNMPDWLIGLERLSRPSKKVGGIKRQPEAKRNEAKSTKRHAASKKAKKARKNNR